MSDVVQKYSDAQQKNDASGMEREKMCERNQRFPCIHFSQSNRASQDNKAPDALIPIPIHASTGEMSITLLWAWIVKAPEKNIKNSIAALKTRDGEGGH